MSPSWEAKNSMEEFGPYATYQAAVDAKARIRGEMPQDFTQINITGNDATGWLVECPGRGYGGAS